MLSVLGMIQVVSNPGGTEFQRSRDSALYRVPGSQGMAWRTREEFSRATEGKANCFRVLRGSFFKKVTLSWVLKDE